MDLSIQCNPVFLRATVGKIVGNQVQSAFFFSLKNISDVSDCQSSQAQATASRIPLGIMCKPMAGDKGVSNDEIEVVDFGATGINTS